MQDAVLPSWPPEDPWRKDRKLVRRGYGDLAYLPRTRTGWNATLAAYAFSARRGALGAANLNLWAAMHAVAPSARYLELGNDGLVFWHGTSAVRAARIRETGLAHKGGVWAATEPRIAHGYTRGRSAAFGAGSAMIVFLISKSDWDARATRESKDIARFHTSIPPECVQYILWPDRVEFVGEQKVHEPKPWGIAHFKRSRGRWAPRSRPPVRLDAEQSYASFDEWLELSIRRILGVLGSAAAIEVFSSLYATLDPPDALEHGRILDELERLCLPPRPARNGVRRFHLAEG
jgi:hypothetical protein